MENPKSETVLCDSMLFEALRRAQVPDWLAFNVYKEISKMAGENVDSRLDSIDSHFDSIEKELQQLRSIFQWSIGIVITLLVIIVSAGGTFANLVLNQLAR